MGDLIPFPGGNANDDQPEADVTIKTPRVWVTKMSPVAVLKAKNEEAPARIAITDSLMLVGMPGVSCTVSPDYDGEYDGKTSLMISVAPDVFDAIAGEEVTEGVKSIHLGKVVELSIVRSPLAAYSDRELYEMSEEEIEQIAPMPEDPELSEEDQAAIDEFIDGMGDPSKPLYL